MHFPSPSIQEKPIPFQQKRDLGMTLDLYPVQEEKAGEREKKKKKGVRRDPTYFVSPPFSFPLVESRPRRSSSYTDCLTIEIDRLWNLGLIRSIMTIL